MTREEWAYAMADQLDALNDRLLGVHRPDPRRPPGRGDRPVQRPRSPVYRGRSGGMASDFPRRPNPGPPTALRGGASPRCPPAAGGSDLRPRPVQMTGSQGGWSWRISVCHHSGRNHARTPRRPMTKRHLMTLRLTLMLADWLSAFAVFMLVSYVRFQDGDPNAVWSVGIDIPIAAALFAMTWVVVLWVMGLYRLRARWNLMTEARDIARAAVVVVAVVLSALFLFHQDDVSRLFLAILFVAQPLVTLASRALFRSWFNALAAAGPEHELHAGRGYRDARPGVRRCGRAPPVAGPAGHRARDRTRTISDERPIHGSRPGPRRRRREQPAVSRPVLGSIYDIGSLFQTNVVDEVAVCLPASAAGLPRADHRHRRGRGKDRPGARPIRPRRSSPTRSRRISRASSSDQSSTTASGRSSSS